MSNEIPSSGSLKNFNLQQILLNLNNKEKNGILTVEDGHVEKRIYIEKGDVVFAESSQIDDRLGERLVKTHRITSEQRDESLERSRKEQKLHGKTLLDLGYLLPKNLFIELKNQISEIIYSLFSWDEGNFIFQEKSSFSDIIGVRINIERLVQEGSKRRDKVKMEEEESFSLEITDIHKKIDKLSYYEILGLLMDASSPEIKKAYMYMVQKFHPDRHRFLSDHTMEKKLTQIFSYINEAYQILSNKTERAKYDSTLLKGTFRKVKSKDSEIVNHQFHHGIAEYNKGNYWGASESFQWVTEKQSENATYWAHLSFAFSRIPRKMKDAESAIKKAINLEPHNADYRVYLGLIYLKAGLKIRAVKQFSAALEWDPTNERAQDELEKLQAKK
jgi:tetratricopeptide (TPR) repeat protein